MVGITPRDKILRMFLVCYNLTLFVMTLLRSIASQTSHGFQPIMVIKTILSYHVLDESEMEKGIVAMVGENKNGNIS